MASLSSKRKTFTNRQLQRRDVRGKVLTNTVSAAIVAVQNAAQPEPARAFDNVLYNAAKVRFDAALGSCETSDVKQVMRALVQQEFNTGGRGGALHMRPYIIKYVGEHRSRDAVNTSHA